MEIDSESENIVRQMKTIEINIFNSLVKGKFTASIIKRQLFKLEDLIFEIPVKDNHLINEWIERALSLWTLYTKRIKQTDVQNSANRNGILENSTANDLFFDISQKEICDSIVCDTKISTSIIPANGEIKRIEDEKSSLNRFIPDELTYYLRRMEGEILLKLNSILSTKSNVTAAVTMAMLDDVEKDIDKFKEYVNLIPPNCAQSQCEWFDRLDTVFCKYDSARADESENRFSAVEKQADVSLDPTKLMANGVTRPQCFEKEHQSPSSKSLASVENFENIHKLNQFEANMLEAVNDETYCTLNIVESKLMRLVEAIGVLPNDCVALCDQWRKHLVNIFEICMNLQKSCEKHLRCRSIDHHHDEQRHQNDQDDEERRRIEKLEIEMVTLIEKLKYDNYLSTQSARQWPFLTESLLSSQRLSSMENSIGEMPPKLCTMYFEIGRLLRIRPTPLGALMENIVEFNGEIARFPQDDTDDDDVFNRLADKAGEVAQAYQLAEDGDIESLDVLLATMNFDCDDTEVEIKKKPKEENLAATGNADFADFSKSPSSPNCQRKNVIYEQIRFFALISLSKISRIDRSDDIPAIRRLRFVLGFIRDIAFEYGENDYPRLQAELTVQALDKLPRLMCDEFCNRAIDRKNLASLFRFLDDHVGVKLGQMKYCVICFKQGHTWIECAAPVP